MDHDNYSLFVDDTFAESKGDAFQLIGTIYRHHLDIHLINLAVKYYNYEKIVLQQERTSKHAHHCGLDVLNSKSMPWVSILWLPSPLGVVMCPLYVWFTLIRVSHFRNEKLWSLLIMGFGYICTRDHPFLVVKKLSNAPFSRTRIKSSRAQLSLEYKLDFLWSITALRSPWPAIKVKTEKKKYSFSSSGN